MPIVQIRVVPTFNNNELIRLNLSESFTITSTTLSHLEVNKSLHHRERQTDRQREGERERERERASQPARQTDRQREREWERERERERKRVETET